MIRKQPASRRLYCYRRKGYITLEVLRQDLLAGIVDPIEAGDSGLDATPDVYGRLVHKLSLEGRIPSQSLLKLIREAK